MRTLLISFVTGATLVLAAGAASSSRLASPPADELAFVRGGQIFVVGTDGTGLRSVTRGFNPKWSGDGQRLTFVRELGRNAEIFTADADGRNVRRLTRGAAADVNPAWSPDGTRIAFSSNRRGRYRLYVMRADGSAVREVTRGAARGDVFSPAWSPDGRLIAFSSSAWTPENPELYVVRPDGSGLRRLTKTRGSVEVLGDDAWPTWSPDGKRIAFTSNRTGSGEVWIMNANGTGQRRIAGFPRRDDWAPSYSADGGWIAFHSLPARGASRLYVVHPNGAGLRSLGIPGTEAAFRP